MPGTSNVESIMDIVILKQLVIIGKCLLVVGIAAGTVFMSVGLYTLFSLIPGTIKNMLVNWPREMVQAKYREYLEPYGLVEEKPEPVIPKPIKIEPVRVEIESLLQRCYIEVCESIYLMIGWIFINKYTVILMCILSLIILVIYRRYFRHFVSKYYKKTVWWMRGVDTVTPPYRVESIIPGSDFNPDMVIPSYQVEIHSSGIWTDKFVAYGVRFHDFLVTPRHVLTAVSNLKGELMIKTRRGSKIIRSQIMDSIGLNDMAYIKLESSIWADLGVTSPSFPKQLTEVPSSVVTCVGKPGGSTGSLKFTDFMGFWNYTGSTVPGMSGAAYFIGNVCYGVHQGVIGNINAGAMSLAIVEELKVLYNPEGYKMPRSSTTPLNSDAKETEFETPFTRPKKYTKEDYAEFIKKKQAEGDLWADDKPEFESNRKGEAKPEMTQEELFFKILGLTPEQARKLLPFIDQLARTPTSTQQPPSEEKMTGHSPDGPQIPVTKIDLETRVSILENSKVRLEAENSVLKEKVKHLEDHIDKIARWSVLHYGFGRKKYECAFPQCDRIFVGKQALIAHKLASDHLLEGDKLLPNPVVQGESAFPADNKTKEELGFQKKPLQKNHQPKQSGTPLRNTLNMPEKPKPSTSTQEDPNDLKTMMKEMHKILQILVQKSVGPNSATTQN
ncbi:hypothetical protein 1 [Hubei sobemo-like virus 34]|uniref:hypothetical protein 1 n=1 Tax=Hubei sobemo-like virus 34 TaxID=1923221 RepID=UPI000909FA97|nr:hypothetical protein 1 [Hubei sobemo-like virus 34]APG75855.1 hypothetical protein 1 [Hubei sobemo-like virus 34]